MLCTDLAGPDEAATVAQRVLNGFRRPFTAGTEEIAVTASVGIAAATDAGPTADEMLSDADAAMYRAKAQGRARFELFDSELRARVHERLDLAHDLRRAIADDQLTVHYQPMVSLATGEPTGFEALLRWEHPERGPISPAVFIPIAEETGSIVELGRWVLERACSDLAEWGSTDRARRWSWP